MVKKLAEGTSESWAPCSGYRPGLPAKLWSKTEAPIIISAKIPRSRRANYDDAKSSRPRTFARVANGVERAPARRMGGEPQEYATALSGAPERPTKRKACGLVPSTAAYLRGHRDEQPQQVWAVG